MEHFALVWALNIPYPSTGMYCGTQLVACACAMLNIVWLLSAPQAHLSDGLMDVLVSQRARVWRQ